MLSHYLNLHGYTNVLINEDIKFNQKKTDTDTFYSFSLLACFQLDFLRIYRARICVQIETPKT